MKEFTLGDHASVFKGSGFNFVGLRDWEPGDRMSSIDWAQSSLTNFSPIDHARVRAEQQRERSSRWPTHRCRRAAASHGVPIAAAIARSVAAVGLSAVFFQDLFGLITFDEGFRQLSAARPRIGKPHVILLSRPVPAATGRPMRRPRQRDVTATIAAHLRKTSLVPVISDFLFADAPRVIKELSRAERRARRVSHDGGCPVRVPAAGRVGRLDSRSSTWKRAERASFRGGSSAGSRDRVEEWQQEISRLARDADLDIVRVGLDRWEMETTLVEFVAERRLRKM